MAEFLKVKTAEEVLELVRTFSPLDAERCGLPECLGRTLAAPIAAPEPLPHFPRASMDGFAVRARDTFGASETLPALLDVSGEAAMGREPSGRVEAGKAHAIATGAMLPPGADAVVMVEYTALLEKYVIEVSKPVAPGENVLSEGEDIGLGELILPAGRRLAPHDLGILAALGVTGPEVGRRPRVAIISTGDEIVPVETPSLPPGKIRDINTHTLRALVLEASGVVGGISVAPDDPEAIAAECRALLSDHDVILISGGSSVGARDFTVRILEGFADSEILVHGVAVRPGKPTILARIGGKMVWGLPGQPVAALMVFSAFVRPSLLHLQGRAVPAEPPEGLRQATLALRLPSVHGRTDYVPVALTRGGEGLRATPLFGKSATIGILARADGYLIIPTHVEGLDEGSEVSVHSFHSG
jgi:molybdopterin molybdotransferase